MRPIRQSGWRWWRDRGWMARTPAPVLFTGATRTSRAGELGISPRRVRAADAQHPFHAITAFGLDLDDVRARCEAFVPNLLPGQVFSHTTALALAGCPLPDSNSADLHVAVLFPRTPPRGRGVHGHSLRRLEAVEEHGLPVVPLALAWRQSAVLLDALDLVVAGDHLVTGARERRGGPRRPARVQIDDLSAAALELHRSPGRGRARWALPRIRSGVDSRPETLARLILVGAGVPEPAVDVAVPTAIGLLHADLGYPALKIAIEYEGDGHRTDRDQWQYDIRRREAMEAAGWTVIRVVADDLFRFRALFVARVRALIERRAALSH